MLTNSSRVHVKTCQAHRTILPIPYCTTMMHDHVYVCSMCVCMCVCVCVYLAAQRATRPASNI